MSFEAAAIANLVAWVLYIGVFAVMLGTRKRAERSRDWRLVLGLIFQAGGLLVLPAFRRAPGSPLFALDPAYDEALEQVVRFAAVFLSFGSAYFTLSAIRTLGKQWALSARVVQDHKLIQTGPYAWVRHPIYTALLGITLGSGFIGARWEAVIVAVALQMLGTWIRVRSEEQLMRATFGAEYANYARAVPAFVPWLRLPRGPASGDGHA